MKATEVFPYTNRIINRTIEVELTQSWIIKSIRQKIDMPKCSK
jgi:hypothetical protein